MTLVNSSLSLSLSVPPSLSPSLSLPPPSSLTHTDNLADPRASSNPNSSSNRDSVSSPTRKAATLERRHTFVAPTSPLRKSPGPAQFNYTPYSKSAMAAQNSQHQQQQQYQQQLNGRVPYSYGRSATLGTHSAQYIQQQMRPYAAAMQASGGGGNLAGVSGRLHMSDMGLQRTGVTGQTGYQMGQSSLGGSGGGGGGYGPPSGGVAMVGARQEKRRLSMNEMHLMSMDGAGNIRQMPPTNRPQRTSFDGGIPFQQQQPAQHFQQQQSPVTNGPVQQFQPYSQPPGPSQGGGGGRQTHQQMPPPPSQGPAGPIATSTTVSAPLPLPPNLMGMTPTSANGYYPPTATAGQIQGYPPLPPGVMSTPGVMSAPQSNPGVISAPQQQQYPMQGGVSGANVSNSSMASHVNTTMNSSPTRSTGARNRGDPLPYATVGVSKTSPPHYHNQPGQTGQTSIRASPGRGGTGGGGAAVLSKLPTSPSRQASVTHSSTGNRPREVVTVSSSATSGHSYYDQLPSQRSRNMPQQQPVVGGAYPNYQSQGNVSCATVMAAPPPTKFTNLQLHQQYHQQYMRLHKEGSKTTPYHVPTSGRPTIQQYQEYQQKQQRERPPVAPKKSPPKHHHHSSHSQPHPHGQSLQYSPHHQHTKTGHPPPPSHPHPVGQGQVLQLGGVPIMHRQQYQPNNAASSATSSPGRPLHVQVNDTSANGGDLVPKSNTGTSQQQILSPQGKQFEPQSTQAYDTLPAESDSLTNLDGSLASVTDELDRFTEEMSRALEQFDSLLQPQTSKPLKQNSL